MQSQHLLDATLLALSDSTRRAILARLAEGEATVSELAEAVLDLAASDLTARKSARRGRSDRAAGRGHQTPMPTRARRSVGTRRILEHVAQGLGTQLSAARSPIGEAKGQRVSRLSLQTEGERLIVVKRWFDAPPEAVYRAHTEPELIQQWMLGPEGWTMPVCI